jgi:hypothetical protein
VLAASELALDAGGPPDAEVVLRRGPTRGQLRVHPAAIRQIAARAPDAAATVAAAYRAAGLAGDPTPGWRARARLAALVPTISGYAGQRQSWRVIEDPTVHQGVGTGVRVAWRLDRLVFDPIELRIATIDTGRRRERRRVAALALRLYYDWLHARAAALHEPRWGTRAAELAAELDALTEGWFSEAAARRMPQR